MQDYTIDNSVRSSVMNWNNKRKSKEDVRSIFNVSGNRFTFTRPSIEHTTMHFYIGYNNNNKLTIHPITAEDDKNKEFNFLPVCPLEPLPNHNLPYCEETYPGILNAISWSEANDRINNWKYKDIAKNYKKRNQWIDQKWNADTNNNDIFQVFTVEADDFLIGDQHDCYLALKDGCSSSGIIYTADLIIVNPITSSQSKASLEDVAAPIPPFKPGGRAARNKFGFLESLNIS